MNADQKSINTRADEHIRVSLRFSTRHLDDTTTKKNFPAT